MEKVGRYRIIGEIGHGGMGVVYCALDEEIGRTVALKMLKPDSLAMKERLRQEARTIGALSHPNIVTVFDLGQAEESTYIVMELIVGPSLDRALVDGKPIDEALIIGQIAAALDYAHGNGIVHRDIKPANILLQDGRTPKIADFGIAKTISVETMTETGVVLGTAHYMAPEQLQGESVSGRTDQFALGVVAYELIAHKKPFQADSMPALIAKILFHEPPLIPHVNQAINDILRKALSKDPQKRYANCLEFASDLCSHLSVARERESSADTMLSNTDSPRQQVPYSPEIPTLLAGNVGRKETAFSWARGRQRRLWISRLALALIVAVVAQLVRGVPFFQLLNLKTTDLNFVLRGRLPTSNIFLVTIDQRALEELPDQLLVFFHRYYAEAIRAAAGAGAKVIGLDVSFGFTVERWLPDYDRELAAAVTSSSVPVIVSYVPEVKAKQQRPPVPVNMAAAALGLAAYANVTDDPDGFIRRQELTEVPPKDPNEPFARSLAMRVAEKFVGKDLVFENGRPNFNGLPMAKDRTITINYAGPPGTFPRVSIVDFLDAAKAGHVQSWVSGKAVLIGLDTVQDRFPTPFSTLTGGGNDALMSGVEIQANILRTLLEHDYLRPLPEADSIAILLAAVFMAFVLLANLRLSLAIPLLAAECAALLIVVQILFRAGYTFPVFQIMLVPLLALTEPVGRWALNRRKVTVAPSH